MVCGILAKIHTASTRNWLPHACFAPVLLYFERMAKTPDLPPDHISEVVQMALADDVSFADIQREYGIGEKHVKALMRENLKTGSYKAWRKRVRDFGDRRKHYK